jgi:hypothetical protein
MFRAATLAALLAIVACGDSEPGGDVLAGAPLGIDDGASRGEARVVLARADRSATIELSTGARVFVPAGAVTRAMMLRIERPADSEALGLVASIGKQRKLASAPYIVTPHGTVFEKDIALTLPVANAAAGKRVQVAWLENEHDKNWKVLGPAMAAADKKVVVPIKHFSVLVLLEEDTSVSELDAGSDVPVDGATAEASASGGEAAVAREDAAFQDDAGVVVDGGGQLPLDASIATRDAAPDAVADGSVGAQSYEAQLLARLRECKLVSREGEFHFDPRVATQAERCELGCFLSEPCADLAGEFCGATMSDAKLVCWADCMGYQTRTCAQEDQDQLSILCDANEECLDGSDELRCPAGSYFYCGSGEVVATTARCDGRHQCSDGSDEAGCSYGAGYFACSDGHHVPSTWECDGEYDCSDGADESNCAGKFFLCNSGESLQMRYVCNGFVNCPDGSDESAACVQLACRAN